MMSWNNLASIALVFAAVCLFAGCYEEPVSAEKTVPAEHRVYLKKMNLSELNAKLVFEMGRVFDSAWTNLSSLVESFDPKSLDYLNADYNSITNVDGVLAFTSLKWLRLNHNKLTDLPDLSPLKNLRRIYLKGNLFSKVPETLKSLPALTDIDLSDNPMLSEIPVWLARKEGLEHLSFSRTKIKQLPENLSAWRSLKTLQLGDLMEMLPAELDRIRAALPKTAVVY